MPPITPLSANVLSILIVKTEIVLEPLKREKNEKFNEEKKKTKNLMKIHATSLIGKT